MENENAVPSAAFGGHDGSELHMFREIILASRELMAWVSLVADMPPTRVGILRSVAVAGEAGAGVVEIARTLGIDAATVTRQVVAMERAGLLSREDQSEDRRRISLRLTEKGMERFKEVHRRLHAAESAALSGISAGDVDAAKRVMASFRKVLQTGKGGL